MTIKHDYDVIGGKPVRNHTANTALSAADRLKEAGLTLTAYTRDQYAQACEIMGVPVLSDDQVITAIALDVMEGFDIKARLPNIPNDYAIVLAYIRSVGIGQEQSIQADTDPNTGSEEQNGDDVPDTTT